MIFYFPCFYWNNIGVKHHEFITDSVNLEPILGFYLYFQFCIFRGSFNILCFTIPVSSKPLPCIGGSQPGAALLKPWGDFFFFFLSMTDLLTGLIKSESPGANNVLLSVFKIVLQVILKCSDGGQPWLQTVEQAASL